MKTKKILHNLSTNICFAPNEKGFVIHNFILLILVRTLVLITMFVAALGRFVLAIDCFAPNLVRLRRAIVLINIVQLYIPHLFKWNRK
jgi:hypothetical protein